MGTRWSGGFGGLPELKTLLERKWFPIRSPTGSQYSRASLSLDGRLIAGPARCPAPIQPAMGKGVPGTQFPKTRSSVGAKSSVNGENPMKILIPTFAVALALAFTAPAFAGDVTTAKTEADCQKAGGMWDSKMNMCMEKKQY